MMLFYKEQQKQAASHSRQLLSKVVHVQAEAPPHQAASPLRHVHKPPATT